tara:strand:+ start:2382 stop:3098 length:717 start_codon:yes stop_codon:yes gene_type:complete
MADRFPLVVDSSNNNIKEIPSGDNLDITGCGLITSSGNSNIGLTPHGTGVVRIDGTSGIDMQSGEISIKNSGTVSNIKLYCEQSNAHYVQLQSPAHSAYSGNVTLTLPSKTGTIIGADANNVTTFLGGTAGKTTAVSSSGGTATFNLQLGDSFTTTLTENTTFAFSNPPAGTGLGAFIIKVKQDGTGGRTLAFPGTVDWAGGSAPDVSTGANDVDIFVFVTVDAGTIYYGITAGQDLG